MALFPTRTARAARSSRMRDDESYYLSSQWQLMWRKFKRHRLATVGLAVLAVLYVSAAFAEFVAGHLLPSFLSYLVVHLTLRVPWMILGETSLSFLGLGIRPPAVSWGALLKEGENIRILAHAPWLLIPGLFVVVAVLAFSFVGDGLRDAADPYR